jgi:hypothetical protein
VDLRDLMVTAEGHASLYLVPYIVGPSILGERPLESNALETPTGRSIENVEKKAPMEYQMYYSV